MATVTLFTPQYFPQPPPPSSPYFGRFYSALGAMHLVVSVRESDSYAPNPSRSFTSSLLFDLYPRSARVTEKQAR